MGKTAPTPLVHPNETLFEYISRHSALLKQRELDLGTYFGDGPTTAQVDDLLAKLRPLTEARGAIAVPVVWDAFRVAVDTEMTWLFPEDDPLGQPLTWGMQEMQANTGKLLEEYGAVERENLDQYAALAQAARNTRRKANMKRSSHHWRLAAARAIAWLGLRRRNR